MEQSLVQDSRQTVADATLGRNRGPDEGDTFNKDENKTRLEGIPPTMTRIESEVLEQGFGLLEARVGTIGVDESEEQWSSLLYLY